MRALPEQQLQKLSRSETFYWDENLTYVSNMNITFSWDFLMWTWASPLSSTPEAETYPTAHSQFWEGVSRGWRQTQPSPAALTWSLQPSPAALGRLFPSGRSCWLNHCSSLSPEHCGLRSPWGTSHCPKAFLGGSHQSPGMLTSSYGPFAGEGNATKRFHYHKADCNFCKCDF